MPPRASHYILRPGPTTELPSGGISQGPGRLVPLIAVDQLPAWLEVVGVPRQLPPEDAVQMIAIGGYGEPRGLNGRSQEEQLPEEEHVFEVRVLHNEAPTAGEKTEEKEDAGLPLVLYQSTENAASVEEAAAAEEATAQEISACELTTRPPLQRPSPVPDSSAEKVDEGSETYQGSGTYKTFDQVLARLNKTPLSIHCLDGDTDALTVTNQSSSEAEAKLVDDLIQIDTVDDPGCWRTMTADMAGSQGNKTERTPQTPIARASTEGSNAKRLATVSKAESPQKSSSVRPCKFWCNYGRCAYRDNCKFVHAMPLTREGLEDVGLDCPPTWWTGRRDSNSNNDGDDDNGTGYDVGGSKRVVKKKSKDLLTEQSRLLAKKTSSSSTNNHRRSERTGVTAIEYAQRVLHRKQQQAAAPSKPADAGWSRSFKKHYPESPSGIMASKGSGSGHSGSSSNDKNKNKNKPATTERRGAARSSDADAIISPENHDVGGHNSRDNKLSAKEVSDLVDLVEL